MTYAINVRVGMIFGEGHGDGSHQVALHLIAVRHDTTAKQMGKDLAHHVLTLLRGVEQPPCQTVLRWIMPTVYQFKFFLGHIQTF